MLESVYDSVDGEDRRKIIIGRPRDNSSFHVRPIVRQRLRQIDTWKLIFEHLYTNKSAGLDPYVIAISVRPMRTQSYGFAASRSAI